MKTHNRFISYQVFAEIDPTDYLISLTKITINIYVYRTVFSSVNIIMYV